jgi:hypothetical protein
VSSTWPGPKAGAWRSVAWLEGDYVTMRPSFGDKSAI